MRHIITCFLMTSGVVLWIRIIGGYIIKNNEFLKKHMQNYDT